MVMRQCVDQLPGVTRMRRECWRRNLLRQHNAVYLRFVSPLNTQRSERQGSLSGLTMQARTDSISSADRMSVGDALRL